MSARVIALRHLAVVEIGQGGGRDQRPVRPLPAARRCLPRRRGLRPCARRGRAGGRISPACVVHEIDDALPATACSSFQRPRQPGVMRASGETQVISPNTSAAPPSARAPKCTRWKSFGMPSVGRIHRHGRDDDAVGERHAARLEWREHRRRRAVVSRAAAPGFRAKDRS